jgi:hypothetical protein
MAGQSHVSWFTNIETAEYTDRREIGNALRLECEVHKRHHAIRRWITGHMRRIIMILRDEPVGGAL